MLLKTTRAPLMTAPCNRQMEQKEAQPTRELIN